MTRRLNGKVCLITGTGGSMGRAAALLFAREGAIIMGCDANAQSAAETQEAVRAAGGTMISRHPCDLTDPEQCRQLIDFTINQFGRIDILYNNAAMAYFNWIEDIQDAEWHRNLNEEVNLVFLLTRAAWPHLKASRGAIVNIASVVAWATFRNLGALAHSTAKAGIVAMTRHLAMEGREYGIRANTISPGIIETNQTRDQLNDSEWADYMLGRTLLGRFGKPDEVANAALFLASEESAYITGVDLRVDGGITA
ncbi:SDR family NAD(P)-dependent oxidoreductase [Sphingobium chlorophenolicum]|uniref:3-oxoacyl-(Acyl-carrier-protein) reductase n=1 Tax=Sphingobium chlorophenolicum TaxID=46429 RepID=A0A081RFE7_SPHCR|nr:SDR family NAD(P)-dependent oxidoreductase [Sphingobium chlorophenolicum]KEQ53920.1 3-oxoacyl-(Acyl-carrier-protein) reductase [Sphingobium chlorophenolicum]